jgi:hypothetical protein
MLPLIKRVRQLINDPQSATQNFGDQEIQEVLDESRLDVVNEPLIAKPTYAPTIQYLNYYSKQGGWEEDYTFSQYLSIVVTPSVLEPIAGHFTFAASTYPPVLITGKLYDVHRAAADLLERLAAKHALDYDMTVNGQSLHRSQAVTALLNLAKRYRAQQRPSTISVRRSDLSRGSFRVTDPTFGDRTGLGGGS